MQVSANDGRARLAEYVVISAHWTVLKHKGGDVNRPLESLTNLLEDIGLLLNDIVFEMSSVGGEVSGITYGWNEEFLIKGKNRPLTWS